jgi:MFS family permease
MRWRILTTSDSRDTSDVYSAAPHLAAEGRRQLALTALVQILAMGLWFSASTVVPALRSEWGLSRESGILLTATVQVGFAAGAIISAIANLADRVRPHLLIATAGAAATYAFPLCGNEMWAAVLLRFAAGFALAGAYPTGMKIVVSWFPHGRGAALGVLLGVLALGSAAPQLLNGLGLPNWRDVLTDAATLALLGALIAAGFVRSGPDAHPFATGVSDRSSSAISGICGSSTRCGPGCPPTSPRATPPGRPAPAALRWRA